MSYELFRGHYVGFRGSYQALKVYIRGNKKITFIGAAENENGIRVRETISQGSHSWE